MHRKILLLFACIILISLCVSSCSYAATYSSTTGGTHALELTGGSATYSGITVTKTGDQSGHSDDYDWKGTNAAVHASGGGTLTITGSSTISSSAKYGNAVFSYGGNLSGNNAGDGTTINISDSTITTTSNNSGGIMATGGGKITASNLTITTSGGSSAAIRSDKGGGTISVSGGTYTTSGTGSPAIYSTAAITGADVTLTSNTAQVVVIEGGNSVTLTDSTLNANHNKLNGQDTTYQAILIYQSQSGDAANGTAAFSMTGGSLTNTKGDIFHVTNTTCTITLSGVTITNNDSSGYFLRASSDSWGRSGSNGGKITLNATDQTITGNILVDSVSSLAMNLSGSSAFKGAINTSGQTGTVSVTIASGSTWTLTANSYVSSLTNNGTIKTGSYTLYVNGTAYTGSSSDDEDDTTAPSITTTSLASGTTGTAYSQTLTASGTTPVTWTVSAGTLPTGLSLSSAGVISGTPTRAGTFTFTVKATNSAGSDTASLTITIASSSSATAPSITTTSLSSGTRGESYSETLTASGTTPITWTRSGGTLPTGLSLSSAGVISGTPTTAGTFTFTVRASNSAGSDTASLTITIEASDSDSDSSGTEPTITTTSLNNATVNKAYSAALRAKGTRPLRWTADNLPDGMILTSSGVLKGKVSEAGTYSITFTASNSAGEDEVTLDLTVIDVKPVIAAAIKPAFVDKEYSLSFRAKSGTGNITWELSDNLPDGLEFDADTATISGTPTQAGVTRMTITATNTGGTATKNFRLTVKAVKPSIKTRTLNPAVRGSEYEADLGITGTSPVSVAVNGLPGGLEYNDDTGMITGTPEQFGTFKLRVKAENSAGSAARTLKLVVYSPPVIDSVNMSEGTAGKTYRKRFTAKGTRPIYWSVSDGELPEGIYLLSNGTLRGKPASDGTYEFTVEANNSYGTDTKTYRLVIAAATPVIKTTSLISEQESEQESELESQSQSEQSVNESVNAGITLSEEYEIIAELPEVKVNESGMYDFEVSADESVNAGKKLIWFAMPQTAEPSSDDEIAEFYDESGKEIEILPDNHKFNVSAWLNENVTYKPVIAVRREEH